MQRSIQLSWNRVLAQERGKDLCLSTVNTARHLQSVADRSFYWWEITKRRWPLNSRSIVIMLEETHHLMQGKKESSTETIFCWALKKNCNSGPLGGSQNPLSS